MSGFASSFFQQRDNILNRHEMADTIVEKPKHYLNFKAGRIMDLKELIDNGGRRRVADRRRRTSVYHFPERRWLRHRRNGADRRTLRTLRIRKELERRSSFKDLYQDE
jgi:hypothetical protein